MAIIQRSTRRGSFSGGARPSQAIGTFLKIVGDNYQNDGNIRKPANPRGLLFRIEHPENMKGQLVVVKPGSSYVEYARKSQNFPASAKKPEGAAHPAFIPAILKVKSDDPSKDITAGDRVKLGYYPARNQDAVYNLSDEAQTLYIQDVKTGEFKARKLKTASVPVFDLIGYGFELFSRTAKRAFNPATGAPISHPADEIVEGHGSFRVRYDRESRPIVDVILTTQKHFESWDDVDAAVAHGISRKQDIRMDQTFIEVGEGENAELHVFETPRASKEERGNMTPEALDAMLEQRAKDALKEAMEEINALKAQYGVSDIKVWTRNVYCMGREPDAWERKLSGSMTVPMNRIERDIRFNAEYAEAMKNLDENAGFISGERPNDWDIMPDEERKHWFETSYIGIDDVMALRMCLSVTTNPETGDRGFIRKIALTGGSDLVRPAPATNMTVEQAAAFDWDEYRAANEAEQQSQAEQSQQAYYEPEPTYHEPVEPPKRKVQEFEAPEVNDTPVIYNDDDIPF